MALEVFGETPTTTDPGESALDDPALGQNDKAMQLGAFDDLEFPSAALCNRAGGLRRLISGVCENTFDERKHAARAAIEHEPRAVAILDIGGVDDDVQEEAERIDENVPLAPFDLLARVIARRIDRRPPFCAPLALWASMIAAVGLASLPSRSRVAT